MSPLEQPPDGYVTIADAADEAEVSYSTVYKLATAEKIRTKQSGAHAPIYVRRDDVKKIRSLMRAPSDDEPRVAVQVRVPKERYQRWEQAARSAARQAGAPASSARVSSWLAGLADVASTK
jgi:hypothetical protein